MNPNATVHAHVYDKLGRLEHDRVTAFGTGIDQTVKRLTHAYDPRGLLERVGSYDSARVGAGSLENEVVFEYDDFGNLSKDRQSHAGAVGSSTPSVTYAHEDGFYNKTRLTAMTYPNGRVVQMGYGTTGGRDDLLSRVASVKIQGESHDAVTYRFAGTKRRSLFNAMFWES